MSGPDIAVAALYKFARHDHQAISMRRERLLHLCDRLGVKGILLLAPEGINGTIAGPRGGLETVLSEIASWPGFEDVQAKWSTAAEPPFMRMKVREKREIVTMGEPDIQPQSQAGTYVSPQDWNALIRDPDVTVVDTRNAFEVGIGTFEGAVDPKTENFTEFPVWAEQNLPRDTSKKIAMFCTGGIRCEKATAFLRQRGYENVFHLEGGILKYLETIPENDSLWHGDCFVFDRRVSLRHGLETGDYQLCSVCQRPFDSGVTGTGGYADVECSACQKTMTTAQRSRANERRAQLKRAEAEQRPHLGPEAQRRTVDA